MPTIRHSFACALALAASLSCANAMDTNAYKGLVKESIQETAT